MGDTDPLVSGFRGLVPQELSGPVLYAAMSVEDRAAFDREFREVLATVTRTFDVEPLSEVVRRWWVAGGRDPAVVEADRLASDAMAHLSERGWPDGRPVTLDLVDRTGPAVFAALPDDFKARFEERFHRAAADAAVALDHHPLLDVITSLWAVALIRSNPHEYARMMDDMDRVRAGDPTVLE